MYDLGFLMLLLKVSSWNTCATEDILKKVWNDILILQFTVFPKQH